MPANLLRFREILAGGAPLLFGGHRLKRLRLSAPPLPLDELRAGFEGL